MGDMGDMSREEGEGTVAGGEVEDTTMGRRLRRQSCPGRPLPRRQCYSEDAG
jgi:hypothetical protein